MRSEFRRFVSGVLGWIGGAVEVGGGRWRTLGIRGRGGVVSGKGRTLGVDEGYWWG